MDTSQRTLSQLHAYRKRCKQPHKRFAYCSFHNRRPETDPQGAVVRLVFPDNRLLMVGTEQRNRRQEINRSMLGKQSLNP